MRVQCKVESGECEIPTSPSFFSKCRMPKEDIGSLIFSDQIASDKYFKICNYSGVLRVMKFLIFMMMGDCCK